MQTAEVRQRFLTFFQERDHRVLPSSSLIPHQDPTLLLTNAGMNQFKPYFLGQADPPHPRVTTVQKCFRTADIEEVGRDGHHLTFFEMLGNFSFGDYFKEKAIPYAFELLTRGFGLDAQRLWATIYLDDEESYRIWTGATPIPPDRVRRFGDEYNFWAPGPTGPCGTDSEIHYDWGPEYGCGQPDCGPNCERCDRFLEVWNLVFITWDRDTSGQRIPLRRKGIDTGMSVERLCAVVNGSRSVYDIDVFAPLIDHWSRAAALPKGSAEAAEVSVRVLADHSRGAVMLITDGVTPSNEGRGYVLRRLIRRAMVHARRLNISEGLAGAVPVVEGILGRAYPEIHARLDRVMETLRLEEERFEAALRQGTERLETLLQRGQIDPEEVFYLHDTLGFPIELTVELAAERGIAVERSAVEALMERQRARSRGVAGAFEAPPARTATRFIGYDRLEADTMVAEVFPVAGSPGESDVFLPETPFYAEGGGQTADRGRLTWTTSGGGSAEVVDVQAQGEAIRHRVLVAPGRLPAGTPVHAAVGAPRRAAVAAHHSATHLLHRALKDVLGEEAQQAGSNVLPDSATFDFRYSRALTSDELRRVGHRLNAKIRADLERRVDILPLQEAIASGAVALFDEKYGDRVRVVSFGDWAKELCGGTHVQRSGEIGVVRLGGDRSIGAGVRRIELRAAEAAERMIDDEEQALRAITDALRSGVADAPRKLEALQAEIRRLEKEIARLKQRLSAGGVLPVDEIEVNGVRLFLQQVEEHDRDLLAYADSLLGRRRGPGVAIVVGGTNFAVKVAGMDGRLLARDVVRPFVEATGGRGGGRGPVASGGGIDPGRVRDGFHAVRAYLEATLR